MIIQKVTNLKAFENINPINEWLVTDMENAIPFEKRHEEPTINMIIDDIRFSTLIDVFYCGEDLKIKRKKVIYSYGVPTEIFETVIIKDYAKIKNDPAIIPLNKKINAMLNSKIKKKLKELIPKILLVGAGIGVLSGAVALYTTDTITDVKNFPVGRITTGSEYVDETDITEKTEVSVDTPIDDNISNTEEVVTEEVVKPPMVILKEYCDIFGLDEYVSNQIYKENIDTILQSDNIEETIMRCVYDFYTENLYRELPTQYNSYTEDQMETFILYYASVLGIDDEEMLYTMLAIHELETAHGTSEYCLNRNNLGGNIFTPSYSEESEFQYYPNAEVGAMDFSMDFYRIYKRTVPIELQNKYVDWSNKPITSSIEYYMNPVYCTEKMNEDDPEWYEVVANVKQRLKNCNRLGQLKELVQEYGNTSKNK